MTLQRRIGVAHRRTGRRPDRQRRVALGRRDTTLVDLLVGQPLVRDVDTVARRADILLAIPLARTRPKQWCAAADHHRREVYTELVHEASLERLSDDVA